MDPYQHFYKLPGLVMIEFNVKPQNLTGRKAHVWQRISAFYLLFYTPFLAWTVLQQPTFYTLYALAHNLAEPIFSLASLIALGLILIHVWVGVRDIMIDYLPRKNLALWLTIYHSLLAILLINCFWIIVTLFSAF